MCNTTEEENKKKKRESTLNTQIEERIEYIINNKGQTYMQKNEIKKRNFIKKIKRKITP